MDENKKAREAIEGLDAKPTEGLKPPVAGPHAKERLTDESKTPARVRFPTVMMKASCLVRDD